MSKWLAVDIDRFNEVRKVKFGGRRLTVMPSPYDLPHSIRSILSEDRQKAIFEFDYLDEEPGVTVATEFPWLSLNLGRHSGRVFKLIVDASHLQSQTEVLEGISRACAMAQVRLSRPEPARQRSRDITNAIMADRYSELARTVAL